jgi:hypothetical protein
MKNKEIKEEYCKAFGYGAFNKYNETDYSIWLEQQLLIQRALAWWNELPLQDIYDCRNGKANQVWLHYPEKTDCQAVVLVEEILHMYTHR